MSTVLEVNINYQYPFSSVPPGTQPDYISQHALFLDGFINYQWNWKEVMCIIFRL